MRYIARGGNMTKLVNKEKKRDWKLINEYHNGVACLVVFFTVLIDLASVSKIVILEKILLVLAIITIAFCLFFSDKYKQILEHYPNKELLSEIINAWTLIGIFVFLVEKIFLQLFDISKFLSEIIPAIILFVAFLAGGILSTIAIMKKPAWKYYVDP